MYLTQGVRRILTSSRPNCWSESTKKPFDQASLSLSSRKFGRGATIGIQQAWANTITTAATTRALTASTSTSPKQSLALIKGMATLANVGAKKVEHCIGTANSLQRYGGVLARRRFTTKDSNTSKVKREAALAELQKKEEEALSKFFHAPKQGKHATCLQADSNKQTTGISNSL